MARNSGVGAADERNRRRLKIIYKGQGQTIPLGWEEGGKENTKNRNETKQKKDDGGKRRAAKDTQPKNWAMEQGEGSKRIQAARRSDEGSERSRDNTAVGGRTTEKTEEKKLDQRGRGLNLRQGGSETRELSRLTRCVACCVSAQSEGELEVKSLEEGPNKHSSGNPININVLLLKTFYCSW
jgi:hypothetical protein